MNIGVRTSTTLTDPTQCPQNIFRVSECQRAKQGPLFLPQKELFWADTKYM